MTLIAHDTAVPAPAGKLQVDVIDSYAEFVGLRSLWQKLEQRDPESTVFLTWAWMAEVLRDKPFRWSILIVREQGVEDNILCILPLKYRVHWSRSRRELQTELEAGGRLLWSEYTGLLCDPRHEQAALAAVAERLARMPWAKLSMRYVAQHRRCRIFTGLFSDMGYPVRYRTYRINSGQTDNLLCPQVDLPEDFDTFLQTQISANKRQQFNRFRRKHLDTGNYAITCASDDTLDDDLDALLSFWTLKWREQKGSRQASRVAGNYRAVLTAAHRTGTLFLPVLRRGAESLGALGHVIDRENGLLHFIVAGRDAEAKEPFIGSALHFHSIEWAIRQGFICYDFCHGNEAYKYSYGAQDQEVLYFEIRRPNLDDHPVLDFVSIGEAMKRAEAFLKAGKTDRAARACAQVARLFS